MLKTIEICNLRDGDLIVFEDGTVEIKINSSSIHLFGGLQARCKRVGEIKNIKEVVFTHVIQGYKIAFTSKEKVDFGI